MHPLRQLMYPSSIAFWGASNNPMKMGTMQLANILGTGYLGQVFPIHPTETTVMGLPAFKSISDVGSPVDLAQLTLPTEVVPRVLDECGKAGIRRAIVISGGFKEVGGDRGKQLEKEITDIARTHGIRFLGPNCVGIFNTLLDLNSTTIPLPPGGGKIAFASQSGAYTAMINPFLKSQGIRMCQTLSVGNEADIDLVDCLDYLEDEPQVEAIGLYIETVRRPREFLRSARRVSRKKPVIAIYVGGTEAGSRSSLSHTGALSGPDAVYDGLFEQAGVIRAFDVDQMFDFLRALASQPAPAGERMAVISNSGGPGSSLAYHVEKAGLSVPLFSDELSRRLDAITGRLAYVRNPIDLTFDTNTGLFKQLLETVFESGEVDGAFMYGLFGGPDFIVNLAKRFPDFAKLGEEWKAGYTEFIGELSRVPEAFDMPLVVMSFFGADSPTVSPLVEGDIPVYPSASRAARAMKALLDYRRIRDTEGGG
jgi:acyl-CoA synthetase (NDP forming)